MLVELRPRLAVAVGVLTLSAGVGRAHQIQNGSFESGINPPTPTPAARFAADPGSTDLTPPAEAKPFTAAFVTPAALSILGGDETQTSQGGSGQGGTAGRKADGEPSSGSRAGGGGSGGGGSGGNRGGSHGRIPLASLVAESADPVYPDADATPPQDAITAPDGSAGEHCEFDGTTGFLLERAPVWVASRASGPTLSLTGDGLMPGDSDSAVGDAAVMSVVHQNPSPPGVILGLMAAGSYLVRLRRRTRTLS